MIVKNTTESFLKSIKPHNGSRMDLYLSYNHFQIYKQFWKFEVIIKTDICVITADAITPKENCLIFFRYFCDPNTHIYIIIHK